MSEVNINHAFISAKPESLDDTIVSKNEWNADEIISGGADGQLVARDSSSSTGGSYVAGPLRATGTGTYSGASPSGALAPVNVTFSTSVVVMLCVNAVAVLSAGGTFTVNLRRDGSGFRTRAYFGGGAYAGAVDVFEETAGSHTYDVTISVGGGATFTSSGIEIELIAIGKV